MLQPTLLPSMSERLARRPSLRRRVRYVLLRLWRLHSRPEDLARGLAAGVFAGSFPLLGLQTALALLLATAVRGNRWVAALGTWVSNPLTDVPIFWFNFRVGRWLLGLRGEAPPLTETDPSWLSGGMDLLGALAVGCLVVGTVGATLSYALGLWLARRWRRQRFQQRMLQPRTFPVRSS